MPGKPNQRISPDSAFRVSLSAAGARGRGGVDRVTKTLNCTSGPVNSCGYGCVGLNVYDDV